MRALFVDKISNGFIACRGNKRTKGTSAEQNSCKIF